MRAKRPSQNTFCETRFSTRIWITEACAVIGALLLNIPVIVLCLKMLGKRFLFRSLCTMAISTVIMDCVFSLLPAYEGDPLMFYKIPQESNYSFFQHNQREFFPCRKTGKPEDFNCLFCYCPLYALGDKCKGISSTRRTA